VIVIFIKIALYLTAKQTEKYRPYIKEFHKKSGYHERSTVKVKRVNEKILKMKVAVVKKLILDPGPANSLHLYI
jgi:hypothetical protein